MSAQCACCGRTRPRRGRGGRAADPVLPLSPGYSRWPAEAEACRDTSTRRPFAAVRPVAVSRRCGSRAIPPARRPPSRPAAGSAPARRLGLVRPFVALVI